MMNELVNIKGDLLLLLAEERKVPKTRKEKREKLNRLDECANKLAKHVIEFYATYSDATYKCATLRELRLEILLWWRASGFFEDYVFNLLQDYFILTKEVFENLKEAESEPSYEFNFKRLKKK